MTIPIVVNNYSESNSLILDLESLTKRYNNLLISYRQSVLNYTNYLKSESNDSMVSVKGSTYWGTSGLTATNSATLQQCQALCASTSGCSGATFNASINGRPLCSLRSGDSSVSSGGPNDYAILSQGKYLLSIVHSINKQLTDINKQIQDKIIHGDELYEDQQEARSINTQDLISQFTRLSEDREKIEVVVKEYENLDEQEKDTALLATQNYYSFLLLFVRLIVIIFIVHGITNWDSYFVTSDGGNNNMNLFLFLTIAIVIIFMPFRL